MASKKMHISQEAFDSVVHENMQDFGMSIQDALEDAIHTFQLQGVDLKGIITDGSGGENVGKHPIVEAIRELESASADQLLVTSVEKLYNGLSKVENAEALSIAGRYGGVEAIVTSIDSLRKNQSGGMATALKALSLLLDDPENRDKFRRAGGCEILMQLLTEEEQIFSVKADVCDVIAAASTRDELAKECFMDCNIAEELPRLLKDNGKNEAMVLSICNAFRSLVTADDNRVVASKTFPNARTFAENGMVESILLSSQLQTSSSTIASICMALRSLAVNDVICKTIAEQHGIEFALGALNKSANVQDTSLAKGACALLSQLAGSDDNKEAIVDKGGFEKLINVSSVFSEDPIVLQECFSVITILSLRSPNNALKAVQAGILDIVAEAMENHLSAASMQRQACLMLRNMAVRSQECRSAILEKGLAALIRRAKLNHSSCKDAASGALRDLGFDDYNS